ncbi:MAG TPA: DUF2239 family protein [Candidatus Methylacidiphilales bacterium]
MTYTTFDGPRRLVTGTLAEAALAAKHAAEARTPGPVLTFDNATGKVVDLDTRGTDAETLARLPYSASSPARDEAAPAKPGRGRPKLGVVPREVTLLPRHWEWLGAQPGGASVALRKLLEEASRKNEDRDRQRQRRDAAYHFLSAIAGDYPRFEEASRALFAGDRERLAEIAASWPGDVGAHLLGLLEAETEAISK